VNKKYVVRLSEEERAGLLALVSHGKAKARVVKRARILLKTDQGPSGPAWTDLRVAEALETSPHTVRGLRQRYEERGLLGAVNRKEETKRRRQKPRKLDGAAEAKLIAIACGKPPEGRAKWSMRLLADELVALQLIDSISHDTVWRTLKKTSSSRT
jgi:transposase